MDIGYRRKTRWNQKQTMFLVENAYKMKDEEIAGIIGKTLKAIRRKRQQMKIKKPNGRGMINFDHLKNGDIIPKDEIN